MTRLALILLMLHLLTSAEARAQLTRAAEVRELAYERSLEKLPVDLTATVTFVESQGTIFVEDETAGTHLHVKNVPALKAGMRVRAVGVTMPGLYLPGVTVTQLEVLGQGPAPSPIRATFDDLATGRYHYQLVEVEGVGRRLTQVDENRSMLRLSLGGRLLEVRVDGPPSAAPNVVDAKLRVVGLAAGGINDRRQLVFPYVRVASWDEITVTERPRTTQPIGPVAVESLMRFGATDQEAVRRVSVRGVVLAAFEDGRVFLRDRRLSDQEMKAAEESGYELKAIGAQLVQPKPLKVGQVISLRGFPEMGRFSATLADAEITEGSAILEEVRPMEATAEELTEGTYDADLVTLPARLISVFRTREGYDLRLEAGAVTLGAEVPASEALPQLEAGALLQITGICQVESSSDKGFRSRADQAVILLRGPGDLKVLQAPAWWTAQRLGLALMVLGGVVVLGLVWIGVLRRQVARQAEALSAGVGQKAALEERQRIAREFHDTLEQELAGLSLRLDAAVSRPLEDKAKGLLETSRQLVKRVQAEARNLVADLRADPTVTADLGAALREMARRVAADDLVAVEVDLQESIPPLPAHVAHHLRMVAQEAVTNALKHAKAQEIRVKLRLDHGALRLTVEDDGSGMNIGDTEGIPGHFGCMGIRERVAKVGGEVAWRANAGGGTCVDVSVPVDSA